MVVAAVAVAAVMAVSAVFLVAQFDPLPELLLAPVGRTGAPNGRQVKTFGRVPMRVFAQVALAFTIIGALVVSRWRDP